MPPIVEVEHITKSFKAIHALKDIELVVPEGQVLGLLGPNGAGKTTLVRILSTLLPADSGTARIAGFDVAREPMRVRRVIGVAGQFSALDDALTGHENLEMIGELSRLSRSDANRRADEILERLGLADAATRLVRTYSGGMKRRLDIGASLVSSPPVLLLDEPTTGLDPRARLELWSYLGELIVEGTSVLLTTQYLEEADQMADEIVVIDHGGVIAQGTPIELKQRVGGEVLEVTVASAGEVERAVAAVTTLGSDAPKVDRETNMLTISVPAGAKSLIEAAKRLDEATVEVVDLALRRPSLDDVFLSLTGHAADDGDEQPSESNQQGAAR